MDKDVCMTHGCMWIMHEGGILANIAYSGNGWTVEWCKEVCLRSRQVSHLGTQTGDPASINAELWMSSAVLIARFPFNLSELSEY